MTPERLYTIPELASITKRSYDFWDEQCRKGRLSYIQPSGPRGARLIAESAYGDWCLGGLGNPLDRDEIEPPDLDFDFEP